MKGQAERADVASMEFSAIDAGRIPESAAKLAMAMLDEPLGRWRPCPSEFLEVHKELFVTTMTTLMDEGRVDLP